MSIIEIKVPDIGGYDGVPVIELLVKPGDAVKKDQGLLTLESDKATMEVPASAAGTIKELKVKIGDTVSEGKVIALLEVDRETGEPKLLRLVAADDAGNLINPLIVEGQIHGGLAQGIGQAMIEEAVYNEDGQLLTGSFMDYALPRATNFPMFEMHSTYTPTPVNPLGAKGVGEAGTLGSTPAVVCAAVDALSEFGVKHIDMMLRPEKLWRIIQGKGGAA